MLIEPGEIDERDLDTVTPPVTPETPEPDAGLAPEMPATSPGEDTAEDAGPKTLAEAIAGALDEPTLPEDPEVTPAAPKPADKPATEAPKEPQSEPETVPDENDPSDAELQAMRPGPRKRVVELLSQRNTARRERDDVAGKLQAAEVDAGNYRQITSFMQQSRLEAAEVRELFDIGAKLKSNDPRQLNDALAILLPLTTGLLELTGRAIPADLKAKVDSGDVTEELARDMARERAQRRIAENRATTVTTEVQQQQTAAQVANLQTSVKSAVAAWEQTVRKTDMDFDRKSQSLSDAAKAVLLERGWPRSPEQAVEYAKEAYSRVNQAMRAVTPRPTATRPSPGATGNRSGLTPAPKSLEEAILGAMSRPAI